MNRHGGQLPGVRPCSMTTPAVHGLGDQYLLRGALNGTWERLEQDLALVTIPGAQHFVQQDAAERGARGTDPQAGKQPSRGTNRPAPGMRATGDCPGTLIPLAGRLQYHGQYLG